MLRITLEKEFGPIALRFGSDEVTPMYTGPMTNDMVTEFRGPRTAQPSKPRIWTIDWKDESARSTLVPNEVAIHYFGDWRSAAGDNELVQAKLIPSFNFERQRVADVWGGYTYTHKSRYNLSKIDVPKMPHVVLENVNANGATVGDWAWRPWEFWKFEDQLAEDAAEQMAELRRGSKASKRLNIADIPEEQLDELAALLAKRKKAVA